MPPKFDKKKTVTFSLVHRSHEDPLYHDPDASTAVFVPVDQRGQGKEMKREQRDKRREKKKAFEVQAQAMIDEFSEGLEKKAAASDTKSSKSDKVVVFDKGDEAAFSGRRENEGEAALYGIKFDDSKYDYMQHLKPIGETSDAVFISKRDQEKKNSRKQAKEGVMFKPKAPEQILSQDMLPSATMVPRNFDSEKAIPDSIAGFNPNMDPSLREVLEALEDEEYVTDAEDDGNEDIFNQLLASGEADEDDFDDDEYDDDDEYYDDDDFYEGNVSDGEYEEEEEPATKTSTAAKDTSEPKLSAAELYSKMKPSADGFEKRIGTADLADRSADAESGFPSLDDMTIPDVQDTGNKDSNEATEQDWVQAFRDFKIDQASARQDAGFNELDSEAGDQLGALSVVTSMTRRSNMTNKQWRRNKSKILDNAGKRVGGARGLNSMNSDALTEMTGLSMSSSALFRNKHLTFLDDRFDTIEEEYLNDQEEDELNDDTHIKMGLPKRSKGRGGAHKQKEAFDMTKERADFESILDDFLDNHTVEGKHYYKK